MKTHSHEGRSWKLIALILFLLFAAGFGIGYLISLHLSSLKDGEYNIMVCSTTDVHGAYFDADYDGNGNATSLSRVASYMKFLRDGGINPVLVDCGDALQGDIAAYYYNYVDTASVHVFAAMADYLGYDAIVVGNHDIETGHSVYDRMKGQFKMPFLAANAVHSEGKRSGKPYFDPYTIVERDGIRIAVIGMTNANIKNWLAGSVWEGIDFQKVSDVAQEWVDRVVKKENPDVVILAMHSGAGNGEGPDIESEGLYIASTIRNVDLIILGHDHTGRAVEVDNPAGNVFVINGGCRSANVAQAVISLKVQDGDIVSRSVQGALLDMKGYEPDAGFVQKFASDYEKVRAFACGSVGSISSPMSFDGILDGPSSVLDLVHKTQFRYTGAQVSITAPLTLDGEIAAGDVAFKDLARLYRFENHLYKVQMTGAQIKGFLEMACYNCINRIGPAYNYDSADGIVYEVSLSAPKGEKVNVVSMSDGSPFCCDSTYTVAMNSYRASGGGYLLRDGALINPDDLVILEKYKDIRTLIGDYIRECGIYNPEIPTNWKYVR